MTNNKAIKGKAGAGGEGTGRKEALRAMDEAARGAGDVCTGSIHPPAIKEQGKETLPMACSISAIVASYSGNDAPDDEGHGPTVVHVSGMAAHLVGLAHGQAVRFANYRRAVGREVTPSDLEEFEATYRAAFTRAAMQTGVLPAAFRWLWAKKQCSHGVGSGWQGSSKLGATREAEELSATSLSAWLPSPILNPLSLTSAARWRSRRHTRRGIAAE
jgi:hypothetical protein